MAVKTIDGGRPGPFDDCDEHRISAMSDREFDERMDRWRSRQKPWHDSEWRVFENAVRRR